jgi:hypothetical protein
MSLAWYFPSCRMINKPMTSGRAVWHCIKDYGRSLVVPILNLLVKYLHGRVATEERGVQKGSQETYQGQRSSSGISSLVASGVGGSLFSLCAFFKRVTQVMAEGLKLRPAVSLGKDKLSP